MSSSSLPHQRSSCLDLTSPAPSSSFAFRAASGNINYNNNNNNNSSSNHDAFSASTVMVSPLMIDLTRTSAPTVTDAAATANTTSTDGMGILDSGHLDHHHFVEDDVEEEEDEDKDMESRPPTMIHLGTCQLTIVGIRYYTGTAHPGEYVNLVREPNNPYDANAIRIDNLHHQKVGHVKREQAMTLAPLLDQRQYQQALVLDGTIPLSSCHMRNDYTLPLQVDLYWKKKANSSSDNSHQDDDHDNNELGIPSEDMTTISNVVELLQKRPLVQFHANPHLRRSSGGAATAVAPPAVKVQTKSLDWQTQQQDLDQLFDKHARDQLTDLPQIAMPSTLMMAAAGEGGVTASSTSLFDYQIVGIRWLVHQERKEQAPFFTKQQQQQQAGDGSSASWLCDITKCLQTHAPQPLRGSILADEMGLGKTIQAIGLILANPPRERNYDTGARPKSFKKDDAIERSVDATTTSTMVLLQDCNTNTASIMAAASARSVFVSPAPTRASFLVAADHSAAMEPLILPPNKTALRKMKVGVLRTLVAKSGIAANGGKKDDLIAACLLAIQKSALTVSDFIMANAPPFQHVINPPDVPTAPRSTMATPKVDDPTTTQSSVCSLVVCPVSVMSNWVQQVETHVQPGTLRVEIYHGPDRTKWLPLLVNNEIDVLIVSYHTLVTERSNDTAGSYSTSQSQVNDGMQSAAKKRKTNGGTLFHHHFHRIILDEAHTIRNINSGFFKAVSTLHADHRLCLTGTPFVNRPDDIQALLAFLGAEPFTDADVYRRAITQPINEGNKAGLSSLRTAMIQVALRRSKALAQIQLSEKQVELRSVEFPTGPHKAIHDTLFGTARLIFSSTLQQARDGKESVDNYMSILEMLLRIRQACCSGDLVPPARRQRAEEVWQELQSRGGKPLTAEEGKILLEKLKGTLEANEECAICMSEIDESAAVILRACGHVFCDSCMTKVTEGNKCSCPLCRKAFVPSDLIKRNAAAAAADAELKKVPDELIEGGDGSLGMSPKIAALLAAMDEMKPDEKGVIFSQFTKFLDLIETALTEKGHRFTRIDGSKKAPERIRAMGLFGSDAADSPRFILCSLHAAGTGINLTRGNHIFMMDTWWNLAAENQAMDRVHRIGQKRDVRVVRFIMAGSIEDRMVALQEAKATLGKGAMEKLKPEEQRKARITALKELFLLDKSASNEESDVEC